jgi:hypothetical protein
LSAKASSRFFGDARKLEDIIQRNEEGWLPLIAGKRYSHGHPWRTEDFQYSGLQANLEDRFGVDAYRLISHLHHILAIIEEATNSSSPSSPSTPLPFTLQQNLALISFSLGIDFQTDIVIANEDILIHQVLERCTPFDGKVPELEVNGVINALFYILSSKQDTYMVGPYGNIMQDYVT